MKIKHEKGAGNRANQKAKANFIYELHKAEIKGPGTMKSCDNPTCTTCLCDCLWRQTASY